MFTSNLIEKNANDLEQLISAIERGDEEHVASMLEGNSMSGWEATPLYTAASCKNRKIIKMVFDYYKRFDRYTATVLKKIMNDWTDLSASDKQAYEFIIYELTCNGDHVSRSNLSGLMLGQASATGNIEIVDILIKHGANLNFREKTSKFVPLHLATMKNRTAVVEYLTEAGADVNMSDKDGNRSLHFAAALGNLNMVKALLKCGAHLDGRNYSSKFTPLHLATEKGHVSVVEELIGAGANVNVFAKDGKSPLHLASETGNSEIVKILLAYGADPNWKVIVTHYTPLHLAVEKGHLVVVESLLGANADVDTLTADGKSSLYLGLEFDRDEIVNVLLDHRANVHIRDKNEQSTLLHTAAGLDNIYVVNKLVTMGIDVHVRDVSGKTPLHLAARHGTEAVKSLLLYGAEKYIEDYNGQIPLHEAIESKNLKALDILFDVNGVTKSQAFYEVVSDILKGCKCFVDQTSCKVSQDANRVLMHLIKLVVVNLLTLDHEKITVHRIQHKIYYDECRVEAEQLRNYFLAKGHVSLYDFLHMKPRCRLPYIETIPSDLTTHFEIYGILIEACVNEAIERHSLFEPTKIVLCELTHICFPDICVERISDFLNLSSLNQLTRCKNSS